MKKVFVLLVAALLVAIAIPAVAQTGVVGTDVLINAKTTAAETGSVSVTRAATSTAFEVDFSSGASAGEVTIYVQGASGGQWCVWGVYTPTDEPHYVVIPHRIGGLKATITSTVTGKTVTVTRFR